LTSLENLIDDTKEANHVFRYTNKQDDGLVKDIQTALSDLKREVTSYRIQASFLQKKAQSTAQSVLDSLNFSFQQLAQDQSKNTFFMARSAREDSVAIRAITLVTSFYLPFSFVAVR
jgi:ABC-type iron transport system FetAB ATPase subunit